MVTVSISLFCTLLPRLGMTRSASIGLLLRSMTRPKHHKRAKRTANSTVVVLKLIEELPHCPLQCNREAIGSLPAPHNPQADAQACESQEHQANRQQHQPPV